MCGIGAGFRGDKRGAIYRVLEGKYWIIRERKEKYIGWPVDAALRPMSFSRYLEPRSATPTRLTTHSGPVGQSPSNPAEIEQKAYAEGVDPRALLASVFSEEPPLAYAQRIKDAIATSHEAQTLEKSGRQARRHLDKQLRRTQGAASTAEGDECALDL